MMIFVKIVLAMTSTEIKLGKLKLLSSIPLF